MVMQQVKPTTQKTPFSSAKVCLIEGEQGSGKTATAVARLVDAYFQDCVRVYCLEKFGIECRPLSYSNSTRVAKIKYNKQIKILKIAPDYALHSPMKIFVNFHLYGIPYATKLDETTGERRPPTFAELLEWMKKGVITSGKLTIDEYYMGANAREGMGRLGRELAKQSNQYRKMKLEVTLITPMARLIDWTARILPTEHIFCSYNEITGMVTLRIRKRGQQGVKQVSYDSRPYRKYYWTNEQIVS